MALDSTILCLDSDSLRLKRREGALRAAGFEVKSVQSPSQARYEIEMGRCGTFITSDLVSDIVNQDLIMLFRRQCPSDGVVLLVAGQKGSLRPAASLSADIHIADPDDPDAIVAILREQASGAGASEPHRLFNA